MRTRSLVAGLLLACCLSAAILLAFPPSVPADLGESGGGAVDTGPGADGLGDGANGEGTPGETGAPRVRVVGGEFGVDQDGLWNWTLTALDREVNHTPAIVVRDVPSGTVGVQSEASAFRRLLVYDDPDERPPGSVLAFVTSVSPNVTINAARLPDVRNSTSWRTVAGVLVHEFTHVVQFQTPAFATNQLVSPSASTDESTAYRAMVEGGAEFVADSYTEQDTLAAVRAEWRSPETSAAFRLSYWPYYRGLVYLDERLSAPAELWDVYEDRPPTTAAILRGEVPGAAPPNRSLSLDAADYHAEVSDRLGAALAEVALTRAIDPARARDVATGWHWDRLRSVQADRDTGRTRALQHVWVTEWRDAAAADAFEGAMDTYLAERFERIEGHWGSVDGKLFSLRRVDGEAVALVVGSEQFLADVSVRQDGTAYAIEIAGQAGADDGAGDPTGEPTASVGTAPAGGGIEAAGA